MKQGLTEIILVLDMSGSMGMIKNDVIGGINTFLQQQKECEGEALVTTVFFDDQYEVYTRGMNIKDVPLLTSDTYRPRGMTALYDAIGKTIDDVGKRLSITSENERPEKVVLVVYTDGEENCSTEYTAELVKEKIEHQRDKYSWQTIFMGANQDAMLSAKTLGINHASNFSSNSRSVIATYATLSKSISDYRTIGTMSDLPTDIK